MPYSTKPKIKRYQPAEPLPQHLDHKPVYALPYQHFDGIYADNTDTKYLSVGLAQWNADEVSIKAMRYTGEKWSRLAEELPLHRVIDMTIFLAKVLFDRQNSTLNIPANTFFQQESAVSITQENRNYGEMASYNAFMGEHEELLRDRLSALLDALNSLRQSGKI